MMNNPFDYRPDAACDEAFRVLTRRLADLKSSERAEDAGFCRELEAGKMLGVLIAEDRSGVRHTLYAFSGQVGEEGFYHSGFVGPVFDYLHPAGYFKTKEGEISDQNEAIASFEKGALAKARNDYERTKKGLTAVLEAYKEQCRLSKLERKVKRASGEVDEDEEAAMVRRSQFEKAELRRLKKRIAAAMEPYAANLREAQAYLDSLKAKRHSDSEDLQQWLFSNFRLLNARGESRSLSEIFAETSMRIPPSGAGECCAPKLLQAAYLEGWHPIAMAEYWYGQPKGGEVRRHGEHYPACRGKCLPVLGWMLQGLSVEPPLDRERLPGTNEIPEILYENEWFCVVNKPSGMLSVPGKGAAVSVQRWLEERYGAVRSVRVAHRLDQDTSGLLIAAFGDASLKVLQSLFAMRKVEKTYEAELEGDYESLGLPREGRIELPLSPDWLDRPRQRVDLEGGKPAVTTYEFVGVSEGRSRVVFHPLTGRTHQLRVHAASETGLGMPIVGDRLYGKTGDGKLDRMRLHARKIEFTFPADGRRYCFETPVPF